jgi:predicted PurR-regulated permease PerM
MNSEFKFPFYAKASLIFIGLFALVSMLSITQTIIVPIIYSIVISIVLSPIVNFFVRKKINRIVSIILTLVLVTSLSVFIILLISSQLIQFTDSFPKLLEEFKQLLHQTVSWTSDYFNISTVKINGWINEKTKEILKESSSLIGQTILQTGSVLVVLVLIPVYVFMILLYQSLLIEFIHKVFKSSNQKNVNQIISGTKTIVQSYLVGLLIEAVIVTTLNSTSLLIIGVNYAILFGVIGAILNLIPYIGGIIAVSLPMMYALVSMSPVYALFVLGAYLLIQLIDNNYLIPKIVASKVKINALISVIVVLAGGALWGIPGMFLSIPLTAILKVIFDHVEPLKPWGFLLGDMVTVNPTKHFNKEVN